MDNEIPDGYKMTELGALPEEWDVKILSDLLLLIKNGTTETQVHKKTDYPVTRIETISDWTINYDKVGYIESNKIAEQFKLLKYDILLSHINSIKHIGKVALYIEEKTLYHGMNLMLLRPNLSICINPIFLYIYLTTYYCKNYFEAMAKPAINQASLSQKEITNLLVPLPPLPEQRRIATILSTLDETVEHTGALIEKYKNIKAGLMSDLLTRGIDEEGRIRSEGTHRFKDSALGRVPEEWEVGTLSDIAQIEMGQSPDGDTYNSVGNGKPLLNGPAEFGVNHPSPVQWTSKSTKTCNPKDILFCVRGSTTGRMNVADQEYCIGRGIAAISENSNIGDTSYIKYILKHKTQYIFSLASGGGSTFPNITSKDLSNLRFTYPPLQEQRRIAEILTAADQRIEKEETYRDKLLQLKKGLMQDLLTGKVRVKAVEAEA